MSTWWCICLKGGIQFIFNHVNPVWRKVCHRMYELPLAEAYELIPTSFYLRFTSKANILNVGTYKNKIHRVARIFIFLTTFNFKFSTNFQNIDWFSFSRRSFIQQYSLHTKPVEMYCMCYTSARAHTKLYFIMMALYPTKRLLWTRQKRN